MKKVNALKMGLEKIQSEKDEEVAVLQAKLQSNLNQLNDSQLENGTTT